MVPQESIDAHHHAWGAEAALGPMAFGNSFLEVKNMGAPGKSLGVLAIRDESEPVFGLTTSRYRVAVGSAVIAHVYDAERSFLGKDSIEVVETASDQC